jgi:hypothetical protein
MSQKILQINFRFHVPAADLAQAFAPAAQPIADTPGLRWKIWLLNAAEGESGGIYLFDDEASVQAYLDGPIIGGMQVNPALSDISLRTFGVAEELSLVTRAPIHETLRA